MTNRRRVVPLFAHIDIRAPDDAVLNDAPPEFRGLDAVEFTAALLALVRRLPLRAQVALAWAARGYLRPDVLRVR